jgi:anaerobic selenocysteine-containing dehydrogenase
MNTSGAKTHYRSCNICEAMCGIEITVRENQILSIRGDKSNVFSRGSICPKALSLKDLHEDPDRLQHPVRRTKSGWERIGWEEAFDEVARNIKSIQEKYGKDAVAVYHGNPIMHYHSSSLFLLPFFESINTKNRYAAASTDELPMKLALYLMFGHQGFFPIPDIDRTDFFLVIGANPVVSGGSFVSGPRVAERIKKIRKRGGKVVVVDPMRTKTAAIADQHYFIRPGSDVLLLLALIHTVFDENLANPGRLKIFTDGIETLQSAVKEFSPEKIASATGIDATEIRRLARDFARAESAVCYGRLGSCSQQFGSMTSWLIIAFNILTGNLDRPGGSMFTRPAADMADILARTGEAGQFGNWFSRVRNHPEFAKELPISVLAEEILTEGEGQVKALLTLAGNPVLSAPNGRLMEEGLKKLDFMACMDWYINETTRYANIILPPTGPFDQSHYDVIIHMVTLRNTAKYSFPVFKPEKDTKHNWEILLNLACRLEKNILKRQVLKLLTPDRLLALMIRFGPYGKKLNPFSDGLTFGKLKKAPHGIDLGPMQPCLPERLFNALKRIQLAPEKLVGALSRVKETFLIGADLKDDGYDMMLIGRRHILSNNSWLHNSRRLLKGKNRCTALLHPEDAKKRNINPGDMIEVQSKVGSIILPSELTEDIMPGIVSIPHGWGHDRPGVQLKTAREFAGVSVNDITDNRVTEELTGSSVFFGVPVRIENRTAGG